MLNLVSPVIPASQFTAAVTEHFRHGGREASVTAPGKHGFSDLVWGVAAKHLARNPRGKVKVLVLKRDVYSTWLKDGIAARFPHFYVGEQVGIVQDAYGEYRVSVWGIAGGKDAALRVHGVSSEGTLFILFLCGEGLPPEVEQAVRSSVVGENDRLLVVEDHKGPYERMEALYESQGDAEGIPTDEVKSQQVSPTERPRAISYPPSYEKPDGERVPREEIEGHAKAFRERIAAIIAKGAADTCRNALLGEEGDVSPALLQIYQMHLRGLSSARTGAAKRKQEAVTMSAAAFCAWAGEREFESVVLAGQLTFQRLVSANADAVADTVQEYLEEGESPGDYTVTFVPDAE